MSNGAVKIFAIPFISLVDDWVVFLGDKGTMLHTPSLVTLHSEEEVPTGELWGAKVWTHTACSAGREPVGLSEQAGVTRKLCG